MRNFEELSQAEREAYIADAQRYLRAEITELKLPFITAECHKQILDIAERCEMDRDWVMDRLSIDGRFVRGGL